MRRVKDGDPLLSSAPWLLAGSVPIGLLLALAARRIPASSPLRWVCAVAAGLAAIGLILLPRLLGASLGFAVTWLPDLAVGVVAGSVTLLIVAASCAIRPGSLRRTSNAVDQNSR